MRKENLDDYELFYVELPQANYYKDIEIQDEYDRPNYDDIQGLSEQQVEEIARDSLDAARQDRKDTESGEQQLFPADSDQP